ESSTILSPERTAATRPVAAVSIGHPSASAPAERADATPNTAKPRLRDIAGPSRNAGASASPPARADLITWARRLRKLAPLCYIAARDPVAQQDRAQDS